VIALLTELHIATAASLGVLVLLIVVLALTEQRRSDDR
jgi:hypothetical protein